MSKAPTAGPKELALKAMKEARFNRNKVPYAGKPFQRDSEANYGLKNAKKKKKGKKK